MPSTAANRLRRPAAKVNRSGPTTSGMSQVNNATCPWLSPNQVRISSAGSTNVGAPDAIPAPSPTPRMVLATPAMPARRIHE